jgi:hypothetical protein
VEGWTVEDTKDVEEPFETARARAEPGIARTLAVLLHKIRVQAIYSPPLFFERPIAAHTLRSCAAHAASRCVCVRAPLPISPYAHSIAKIGALELRKTLALWRILLS